MGHSMSTGEHPQVQNLRGFKNFFGVQNLYNILAFEYRVRI